MTDIEVQREILMWGYEQRYERFFEITEINQLRDIDEKQKSYNVELLVNIGLIKYQDESGNLLSMTGKGLKLLERRDYFDRQFPSNKLNENIAIKGNDKSNDTNQYDAFIAHASEDKDKIARPLANLLRENGLNIWYDEFTLQIGDSLRRSIDKGLVNSRFGIVILSPAFFRKEWPQKELDGLTAREIDGKKVILPIWHNVTKQDVLKYSPLLADKVAAKTEEGLQKVLDDLLKAMEFPQTKLQNNISQSSVNLSDKRRIAGVTAKVLDYMVRVANERLDSMPEPDEIVAALDITLSECKEAFEELESLGIVDTSRNVNSPIGYSHANLDPSSFIQLVGEVIKNIDIVDEIKRTLNAFPSDGNYIPSETVFQSAKVPLARLQLIVSYLHKNNCIEVLNGWTGEDKLRFSHGRLLPFGKRILRSDDPLPGLNRYLT